MVNLAMFRGLVSFFFFPLSLSPFRKQAKERGHSKGFPLISVVA